MKIEETMYGFQGEFEIEEVFHDLEFEVKVPKNLPEEMKFDGINIITHDGEQVLAEVYGGSSDGKAFTYYVSKVELSHSKDYSWEALLLDNKNALIAREEHGTAIRWEDNGLTYELSKGPTLDEDSLLVIAEAFE